MAVKAQYSACKDDLENVNCLYARSKIKDPPRKNHWPDMDLIYNKQPSHSTSEKPINWIKKSLEKISFEHDTISSI